MWRPDDWKNGYKGGDKKDGTPAQQLDYHRARAFEAGADAMLRAIITYMEANEEYEEIAFPEMLKMLKG